MSKDWQVYAKHVRDTIAKINRIRERGDLTTDEVLYDATLRNLQTLSEATQRIPDTVKQRFPEIPWKEISGFPPAQKRRDSQTAIGSAADAEANWRHPSMIANEPGRAF